MDTIVLPVRQGRRTFEDDIVPCFWQLAVLPHDRPTARPSCRTTVLSHNRPVGSSTCGYCHCQFRHYDRIVRMRQRDRTPLVDLASLLVVVRSLRYVDASQHRAQSILSRCSHIHTLLTNVASFHYSRGHCSCGHSETLTYAPSLYVHLTPAYKIIYDKIRFITK